MVKLDPSPLSTEGWAITLPELSVIEMATGEENDPIVPLVPEIVA
jgi:hypothetical protein